jgi:anti-sigma B factor antagonist
MTTTFMLGGCRREQSLVAFTARTHRKGVLLMLDIQTKDFPPDIVVLETTGRITLGRESKQLEWAIESLAAEGRKKVILELTGVTNIDSTGIGIIVMSAGRMKKAGGELRVACAAGHVEQVLKMTNVDQIVAICPTTTEAAASF